MIRQRLVHIEEIGPPALESSHHIGSTDIVAPLPHSARDPTERQKKKFETVGRIAPPLAPNDWSV
jgi:hypothetical protein